MASPAKRPFARGFAADRRTERALRAGLAGRDVQIQRGRLTAALRTLAVEPASRLVFVDLDGIEEPEAAARQLIGICAFETALVAIGSVDTAHYGRSLLQLGIADYLVKPVTAAAIRDAVAALTDDMPEQLYAGQVIAFAGSPGSGTSTLVAAVARGIVADGRVVSVVDLDPMSGKLPSRLSVEPREGLSSLLALPAPTEDEEAEPELGLDRLDEIVTPAGTGISLVAYSSSGPLMARPPPAALSTLFKRLANRTHVVLVAGLADPETQLDVMRQGDGRILVYEPTLPSIGAAVRLIAQLGPSFPVTLVQCSTRMRGYPLSAAHVRYALADRRPDIVVPFEPALHAGSVGKSPGRPGKVYRKALQQVTELVGRGSSPETG